MCADHCRGAGGDCPAHPVPAKGPAAPPRTSVALQSPSVHQGPSSLAPGSASIHQPSAPCTPILPTHPTLVTPSNDRSRDDPCIGVLPDVVHCSPFDVSLITASVSPPSPSNLFTQTTAATTSCLAATSPQTIPGPTSSPPSNLIAITQTTAASTGHLATTPPQTTPNHSSMPPSRITLQTTAMTASQPAAVLPQTIPQMEAAAVWSTRPLPAAGNRHLPHDPTVATAGSPAIPDAGPSSFKKQMDPTFTEQRRKEIQLQEEKQQRDEAIKMNKRKAQEIVMVYAWTEVSASPITLDSRLIVAPE
ncbi:hypothetical protein EVG20_g6600 [Dentipellis fragilis]|uniref:Uncharacterized protein n=1 Tax=Dentipellis fragilis TaxID=205917 RepID=A0A4Y9YMK8_9AGAM|nr:hypothetical protein EVG20_g6600 [Dentipellis fragilis]